MNGKELLTKDRISEDLQSERSWAGAVVVSVMMGLVSALLIAMASWVYMAQLLEQWLAQTLYILFLIVAGGGTAALIVFVWVITWRRKHSVEQGTYRVVLDRLVHTEDGSDHMLDNDGRHRYLIFASFGQYEIPLKIHYAWSEQYAMTGEGIYNTAVEGDMFYIVTGDNKTILTVYNTKFFEYKE